MATGARRLGQLLGVLGVGGEQFEVVGEAVVTHVVLGGQRFAEDGRLILEDGMRELGARDAAEGLADIRIHFALVRGIAGGAGDP